MKGLWLRWSWRDLRSRWLQVAAIALIIALGTGVYTGLSSQNRWRSASYDESYEALAVHDFIVTTPDGTTVDEGSLLGVLATLDEPEAVTVAEERLQLPTQVDASELAGDTVLVPGRIVGVDVQPGSSDGKPPGPQVDRIEIVSGRGLEPGDAGQARVVLDSHFADHHQLPSEGTLPTSNGPVDYVGTGYSPEYFLVASDTGSILAEAGFAVMFAPLETAQELSGQPGRVNQLVLRVADDVDPATFEADLGAAFEQAVPDVATEVEWVGDNRQYRRLYDDIDGDQRLFNIFAGLILAGAAFAAFNLTGRIVEAQRREFGIGMSLGLDRWKLAIRPLLVALQISLLGVVLGIGFGWYVGTLMADLNLDFVPLPIWDDAFQVGVFARGAALGLVLTFAATIWPVWRAVRVDPVAALSTRPRSRGAGADSHERALRMPGNSLSQFPLRNAFRAPRRTALTALGIAAVITVLIAVIGMVDSFVATIDQSSDDILADTPERVDVNLDFFYPTTEQPVTQLADVDGVATVEPGLRIGGWLVPSDGGSDGGSDDIETLISVIDLKNGRWRPTISAGSLDAEGLVISEKAAEDLGGLQPGDEVTLRHPVRDGLDYTFEESQVPIAAIHTNPYRFQMYVDTGQADLFGLDGIANIAAVYPADGVTARDLERSIFGLEGIAAVESVRDVADNIRDAVSELLGFLNVVQVAVLLLAVLIAFNSTSISADERRREHATMFAFGVPLRTVMGITMAESAIIGALGTALGLVAGRLLLQWLIEVLLPQTDPDLSILVDVSTRTYLTAAVLGIVAVAVAPVLTARRLRRMDVPATLRVIE